MATVNVGPLTTLFTPPSTCLAVITSGLNTDVYASGYSAFVGNFGGNYISVARSCYPGTTTAIDFWQNYYWSPGVCPSGYTPACSLRWISFAPTVTASLCCPRGFRCKSEWLHGCSSTAGPTLTNVWLVSESTETLDYPEGLATITRDGPVYVYGDGVPVAWAQTDIKILSLLSSSSASLTSRKTSSSSPGNVAAPTTTSSSHPASTLTIPSTSQPVAVNFVRNVTLFFRIQQQEPSCQAWSSALLWFISLMVFACSWTLIAGPNDIRAAIRKAAEKLFSPLDEDDPSATTKRMCLSLGGSLVLQITMAIATAAMLWANPDAGSTRPAFVHPLWAWLVRPMPATAVAIMAVISPAEYMENVVEIQVVEVLIGLLAVGLYGSVMLKTFSSFDGTRYTDLASNSPAYQALQRLQAGTVFGFITWIITWIILLITLLYRAIPELMHQLRGPRRAGRRRHIPSTDKARTRALIKVVVVLFNIAKLIAGFLIWGGTLALDPDVFCPKKETITGITVLWAFVPAVDQLWRACFSGWMMREKDD